MICVVSPREFRTINLKWPRQVFGRSSAKNVQGPAKEVQMDFRMFSIF